MSEKEGKHIELKPCPFCGAIPVLWSNEVGYDVKCKTDGCYMEYGADWLIPLAKAIKMWNKRAGEQ